MDISTHRVSLSNVVASLVFHTFLLCGEIGILSTILIGITAWTMFSGFLLWLAGVLTFVYPHVGTHPRLARLVWGRPRRSTMPWLLMLCSIIACLYQILIASHA